jgi:sodium/proline symporter
VAAGAISYDLPKENKTKTLMSARLTVAIMCLLSMLLAIYAPKDIFSRVLFAWNALGAAFGPVLIVLLMKRYIAPKIIFASIFIGFTSTAIFHWLPALPGDVLERIVPFIIAFLMCLIFSKKVDFKQEA